MLYGFMQWNLEFADMSLNFDLRSFKNRCFNFFDFNIECTCGGTLSFAQVWFWGQYGIWRYD